MSPHLFIEESFAELRRGAVDVRHPFRYFTFATQSEAGVDQRMVVLRLYDLNRCEMVLYTDSRSEKMEQLKLVSTCHALFWHPRKKLQMRLTCQASFEDIGNHKLPNNLKDYSSKQPPGQKINEMSKVAYIENNDAVYFQPIRLKIKSFDILQLHQAQPLRASGKIDEGVISEVSWLVP